MTGFQIVEQGSVGFTDHGDAVYSTASYVKVAVSFKSGSLRLLHGAPLSVFICLALHEADSDPGASLTTIEGETGYSSPSAIKAIRFLRAPEHHFIDEIGTDDDGTKRFRVVAYAWVGNSRKKEGSASIAPSPAGGGKVSLPGKVFSPVVVSSFTSTCSENEQQQQQLFARARNFLHAAGICDPALTALARTVAPERAEMWADWLSDPPASFTHPAAYAIKRLTADSLSDPPRWTLAQWQHWREQDAAEFADDTATLVDDAAGALAADAASSADDAAGALAGEATSSADEAASCADDAASSADDAAGALAGVGAVTADADAPNADPLELPPGASAGDQSAVKLWDIALKELQGQMTRATFDRLLRPTRALGFDRGQLVVHVASSDAKEWLEQRLAMTVERTLTGIAGRAIAVRYEVNRGRNPV